jgi:O-antigen biosynthesis protein
VSPEPRRRAAARERLLATGLVDRDWIGVQLGTAFATDEAAVDRYLDGEDCSPHPLFEGLWCDVAGPWRAEGIDALSWYVGDERRRRTLSPHPMVDLTQIVDEHPESRAHPFGPLAWWVASAEEDTPVPVPAGVPAITWGRLRAAALDAATRRGESSEVRLAQRRTKTRPEAGPETPPLPRRAADAEPLVTVVLAVHDEAHRLRRAIDAVQAQTFEGWELIVVDDGSGDDTPAVLAGVSAFEPRVVTVTIPRGGAGRARNAALDKARGRYVAFADTRHVWDPDFLSVLLGHLEADDSWEMAHAALRFEGADGTYYRALEGDRDHLLAHEHVNLAMLVARRDLLARVGGFDERLEAAEGLDLVLKLAAETDLHLVPGAGVEFRRDAREEDDPVAEARWTALVLERHLVDWATAQHVPREDRRLSIVLHAGTDLDRTARWVTRTLSRVKADADVELVVVGVRMPRAVELPLSMLLAAFPRTRLLTPWARIGATVATNLGVAATTGEVVVLARTTATPPRDVFGGLVTALADDGVALAQPLLVDRAGLVVSAGAVFGPGRTHPEPFLAGHPVRDALALSSNEVPAPLSPIVAARASTLLRLCGFDARAGDALPEVELGIRMAARDAGRTVVTPHVTMVLKAGQLARLDSGSEGVQALQQLCPVPPDGSEAAWQHAGFEVVGRRWESRSPTADRDPLDAPALTPRTLVRPIRPEVREAPPVLRWALDIAAPSGRRGQRWGDSYFARSMADALERLGQRVTIDTRDLRHRETRDLDDVVLVLRGLDQVAPRPGRVNLEWVISHPDLVGPAELAAYDRVYAASTAWSAAITAATGITVTPLLQCTDPRLFNPDRAEPDTGPAVLFVGNSRDVYRRSVRSALAVGVEVQVHGSDWETFLPPHLISSRIVANEELGALYASAGVVLNDHWDDMRRDGFLANRLFDVTACAARLVTDEIAGLEETFGNVVRTFHDEQEMGPLLHDPAAAFPDREARVRLAETVMREHSFDHRAEVLLDDAVRLLAR